MLSAEARFISRTEQMYLHKHKQIPDPKIFRANLDFFDTLELLFSPMPNHHCHLGMTHRDNAFYFWQQSVLADMSLIGLKDCRVSSWWQVGRRSVCV